MENSAKSKPHHPLFMQPIIPDFLNSFSIPVSFKEKLEKEGYYETEKVVLVNEIESRNRGYDNEWEVQVKDGRHFKEGWKEFCDDHKLNVGEFLVFRHLGNLVFHVSVYDPATACERQFHKGKKGEGHGHWHDTFNHTTCHRRKPLEAVEAAATQASDSNSSFVVTLTRWSTRSLNLPMAFVRSNEAFFRRCCQIKLIDGKGKSWQVMLNYRKSNAQSYISQGWKDFQVGNNLKPGNVIRLKVLKDDGNMPAMKCRRILNRDGRLTPNRSITHRRKPVDTTTEVVKSLESQSSYCDLTITRYSVKRASLYLPVLFVRSNGLRHCQVELIDGKGKSWQVKLNNYGKSSDRLFFGKGWRDFQVANDFKPGNVIRFEILKDGGKLLVMKCYKLAS